MKPKRRLPPAARSAARLGAVQALYQMDIAGTDVGEVLAQFSTRVAGDDFEDGQCGEADYKFLKEIVDGVVREQKEIDPAINEVLAKDWPLPKLDSTVRAILRAGSYELMFMDRVPARVALNEYVELAHAFFDGEESGFINGVLNQLARVRRPAEFGPPA
jgi:transcription antitermination protein NusB